MKIMNNDILQLNIDNGRRLGGHLSGYSLTGSQFLSVGKTEVAIAVRINFEINTADLKKLTEIHLDVYYMLDNEQEALPNGAEEGMGVRTKCNDIRFKAFVITPTFGNLLEERFTVNTEHLGVDVVVSGNVGNVFSPTLKLIVYDLMVHSDETFGYTPVGIDTLKSETNTSQPTSFSHVPVWNTIRKDSSEAENAENFYNAIDRMSFDDDFDETESHDDLHLTDEDDVKDNDNDNELCYNRFHSRCNTTIQEMHGDNDNENNNMPNTSENLNLIIEENENIDAANYRFLGNDYGSEFILENSHTSSANFEDIQTIFDLSTGQLIEHNYGMCANLNNEESIESSANVQPIGDNDMQEISQIDSSVIGVMNDPATQHFIGDNAACANSEGKPYVKQFNSNGIGVGSAEHFKHNYYSIAYKSYTTDSNGIIPAEQTRTDGFNCTYFPTRFSPLSDHNTSMDIIECAERFPPINNDRNETQNCVNLNEQDSDELCGDNHGIFDNMPIPTTGLAQTDDGLVGINTENEDLFNVCNSVCHLSPNQNITADDVELLFINPNESDILFA